MAFFKIEYHSKLLRMERQVNVIYPDAFEIDDNQVDDRDIPVLYLLHGSGGNENSFQKRTDIERLLRHTNLIVVMPSTDLAWYTDTAYDLPYFRSIAEELPQVLQRFFPNMTKNREKTFIAGVSMGGYGAYKIALSTNHFSHAAAFSGALKLNHPDLLSKEREAYWSGIFGGVSEENLRPHLLTRLAAKSDKQTEFFAWCGYEDFLYPTNEEAVADLRKEGLLIDYRTSHGSHDWYYWNQQLEAVLEWLPIDYVKEERLS